MELTERERFLAVLAANEDDVGCRMAYADWLEEHGEDDEANRQRAWPEAKAWLKRFCDCYRSYEYIMEHAAIWVEDKKRGGWGEYIVGGEEMEGEYVPEVFWDHYEVITGVCVNEEHRGNFFSCSC